MIGWDVDPNFASVSGLGGLFTSSGAGAMSSLGAKEVCLKAGGGNNCSGGGGGGLWDGTSGSGAFTLNFASQSLVGYHQETVLQGNRLRTIQVPDYALVAAPGALTFSNFGVHYQSLAAGGSTVGILSEPPPPPPGLRLLAAVPEPEAWAMMILGFFGVGSALRRRQSLRLA